MIIVKLLLQLAMSAIYYIQSIYKYIYIIHTCVLYTAKYAAAKNNKALQFIELKTTSLCDLLLDNQFMDRFYTSTWNIPSSAAVETAVEHTSCCRLIVKSHE